MGSVRPALGLSSPDNLTQETCGPSDSVKSGTKPGHKEADWPWPPSPLQQPARSRASPRGCRRELGQEARPGGAKGGARSVRTLGWPPTARLLSSRGPSAGRPVPAPPGQGQQPRSGERVAALGSVSGAGSEAGEAQTSEEVRCSSWDQAAQPPPALSPGTQVCTRGLLGGPGLRPLTWDWALEDQSPHPHEPTTQTHLSGWRGEGQPVGAPGPDSGH